MFNNPKKKSEHETPPTKEKTADEVTWKGGTYKKLLQAINASKQSTLDSHPNNTKTNSELFKKMNPAKIETDEVEMTVRPNTTKKK